MFDLHSRLKALKLSYDDGLITKGEYNEYRLKVLDKWSGGESSKKKAYLIPLYFGNFYLE